MSNLKVKLSVIIAIILLGGSSLYINISQERKSDFDLELISILNKEVNNVLSSGCAKIYKTISLNASQNYMQMNLGRYVLQGAVKNIQITQTLKLRVINTIINNIELSKSTIYMYEDTAENKCYGSIF